MAAQGSDVSQIPLELKDFSGGLNNRDPRSGIPVNQLSELENYLTDEGAALLKRGGQNLLQYAPIQPEAFVNDANTLGLWHLDETAGPYADSATTPHDFIQDGQVTAVAGVFSNAQKPAKAIIASGNWVTNGSLIGVNAGASLLDGLPAICMESWCYIDPTFSAEPITATIAGTPRTLSDSGSILVGSAESAAIGFNPGTLVNGITCHRDWDAVNNRHSSDCYFKFALNTNGIAGTRTVLTGNPVPFSRKLEVRGEYDSATGYMDLYVNGRLHVRATPNGGGTVDNTNGTYIVSGGQGLYAYTPTSVLRQTFNGWIDEIRISNVTRSASGFPFRKPIGKSMVLTKADGTNQLVQATDRGLFYTIGDLDWTLITDTDPADGALLSPTAKWDGVLINDRLYMTNGVNTPLTWDGLRLVPTFEGVTPMVLSLTGSGSGNTNGAHKYVYTYKYGDLDETGFSPVAEITVTGNQDVNMGAIPTRHDNCTSIRIYKTKAGGDTYFLDREVANDPNEDFIDLSGPYVSGGSPDTDSGGDGVADGSTATNLNDDADYGEVDAIVQATVGPKAKYYLGELNRLFAAGMVDAPYTMRPSALGNPDVMRPDIAIQVPTDRGFIVAIYSYYGEIHVSLNGLATNVLHGTDESNWSLTTNLSPNVGARDHWAVEHRYPVGDAGPYIVVIAGPDGLYQYTGQKIEKISDHINPTFDGFSYKNAQRNAWLTTTEAEYESAASNGGSATVNVQQPAYETDGLRETPNEVKVVNQLDYIALWTQTGAPVVGNIIATAKADGEGAFYFGTDSSNELYYTPDNLVTISTIGTTPLGAAERIIQIVRRGTDDFWFCLTDSAGTDYSIGSTVVCKSSGGGKVYAWDNVAGAWTSGADTLFYDLDVQNRMNGNINGSNGKSIGNPGVFVAAANSSSLNIFSNHAQTLRLEMQNFTQGSLFSAQHILQVNANLAGTPTSTLFQNAAGSGQTLTNYGVAAGFYDYASKLISAQSPSTFTTTLLRVDYTRREYPRWRGGTFAPQAFWDSANNRLCFLASGTEDAFGNRPTSIRTIDSGLTLTTYTIAGKQVSALVAVGTDLWMWTTQLNTDGGLNSYTWKGRAERSTLAAPGTIAFTAALTLNLTALRLGYNADNTALMLGLFKSFEAGQVSQDFYTYTASMRTVSVAAGVVATLLALTANADSGPVPIEFAKQTTTPYKWFVAVDRLTTVTMYDVAATMAGPSDVGTLLNDPYQGVDASAPVSGIRSNLLFVAQSGIAGGYKWADRLYWMADNGNSGDQRMLQRGVPGSWEVRGELVSRANDLGIFTSFGNLTTDFSGNVQYFFRSAANQGALAATDLAEAPNQPIAGFSAPGAWAQWRTVLIWVYTVATPTVSPVVKFVLVEYFQGDNDIPRPVAVHWAGRTYFAFATNGAEENDTVVVYDKKNAFTVYKNWRIKGFTRFRGQLTAIQDYELVQLEVGNTDLGAVIKGHARTGVLAGDPILSIQDMEANLVGTQNQYFPDTEGALEIVPMGGEDELDTTWILPIPTSDSKEINRVHGIPPDGFDWAWGQAFSLVIRTSERTTTYVAVPDQQEVLQKLDLKLVAAKMGRNFEGK